MTIYDLTQAMKRYRWPILAAIVALVVTVVFMTFTFRDGKVAFRSELDYEASVQIVVVDGGTDSLISSDGAGRDLTDDANLYASMLRSAEAAEWIAEQNGYDPLDTVDANSPANSETISATVVAPTAEQAKAAALSTFAWLNKKLLEPITTSNFPTPTTTVAPLLFTGPVQSQINIAIGDGLTDTAETLFLRVETETSTPFAFSIAQNAGGLVRSGAILDPLTTVVLTLLDEDDEIFDIVRLAPPPAPRVVSAPPELGIALTDGSIDRFIDDETTTYRIDSDEIELEWQEGFLPAETDQVEEAVTVELALLTTDPGVTTSGGRRGPILALSVLMVGFILIIAAVVVADTWRKDRDAQTHVAVAVRPADVEVRPADATPPLADVEDRPADVEVRPADANPNRADPQDETGVQKPSWKQ